MRKQLGFFHASDATTSSLDGRGQSNVRNPFWIPIPTSGVSYLAPSPGSLPQVFTEPGAFDSESILLEPVLFEHQLYLVLMAAGRRDVRVNGVGAGPLSILRAGDQVQIGPDCVLHVSALRTPYVGPPDDASLGRECPICRVSIDGGRTVYCCPDCGTAMHCEGHERDEAERLECALACSACPRCGLPIVMTEEYAYVPEV